MQPELFTQGVFNRGISGQTSSQMLLRFMADVAALHPRFVHILAGTNDVAGNGGPLRTEDYQDNITAMVDIAKAHRIRVILSAIPPADHFGWRPGIDPRRTIADLNAWLRAFASRRGLSFVDYHSALATPSGALKPEFGDDGVHPNRSGYAVMAALAAPAIKAALRQTDVDSKCIEHPGATRPSRAMAATPGAEIGSSDGTARSPSPHGRPGT